MGEVSAALQRLLPRCLSRSKSLGIDNSSGANLGQLCSQNNSLTKVHNCLQRPLFPPPTEERYHVLPGDLKTVPDLQPELVWKVEFNAQFVRNSASQPARMRFLPPAAPRCPAAWGRGWGNP